MMRSCEYVRAYDRHAGGGAGVRASEWLLLLTRVGVLSLASVLAHAGPHSALQSHHFQCAHRMGGPALEHAHVVHHSGRHNRPSDYVGA